MADHITSFDELFAHGSRWLRADVHLRSPSDGHFSSRGVDTANPAAAHEEWVNRLVEEGIRVGVVTNHNKFDLDEFNALNKRCRKEAIGLFPGVELSVRGGGGSIHILIVFERETWINNKERKDFINRFLGTAFEHVANFETDDVPCKWDIGETLRTLEEHQKNGRDSFVVLAHVDDKNGVFRKIGPGLRHEFNDRFRHFVLGAQVAYVKLGEMSFSALRLALVMKEYRVRDRFPPPRAGRIDRLSFTGGLLDGCTINLSAEMTNLIGIRGSGKSSVLEAIRYAFGIDLKSLDGEDIDYKETLVQRVLGSGGAVKIEFSSGDGKSFTVVRVLNDSPVVYRDDTVIPDIRPGSLLTVRYFGQKDLARFSERKFAHELIERFAAGDDRGIGNEDIHRKIQSLLLTLEHHDAALAQLDNIRAELASVKESLTAFDEHNLHEKLQSQIAFENELRQASELLTAQDQTVEALKIWYDDYYEPYRRKMKHTTNSDQLHLHGVREAGEKFLNVLGSLEETIRELESRRDDTRNEHERIAGEFSTLRESFAAVRRTLTLPENLSPDTYVALTKREKVLGAKLSELDSIENKRSLARKQLERSLVALQNRWHEQFETRKTAVQALNDASAGVQIEITFKDDKSLFAEQLNTLTTGIQRRTVEKIAEAFSDGIEIYRDLAGDATRLRTEAGVNESQIEKLREAVNRNTQALLTFRPPDRVELTFRGKPLHEHSLGQRATALMLFLLSQDDIDVLIVDQPEDDLDNQTVYAEIVSRILEKKGRHQIIFATHNPNIPVLGDAEQIVRCRFAPGGIDIAQGAVDNRSIQREIVSVMEGGSEAFTRRQRIYDAWTR